MDKKLWHTQKLFPQHDEVLPHICEGFVFVTAYTIHKKQCEAAFGGYSPFHVTHVHWRCEGRVGLHMLLFLPHSAEAWICACTACMHVGSQPTFSLMHEGQDSTPLWNVLKEAYGFAQFGFYHFKSISLCSHTSCHASQIKYFLCGEIMTEHMRWRSAEPSI